MRAAATVWRERIVVTTAAASWSIVRAFVEAGAKAVVCRDAGKVEASPEAVAAFFSTFYHDLMGGRTMVHALKHAGKVGCKAGPMHAFILAE